MKAAKRIVLIILIGIGLAVGAFFFISAGLVRYTPHRYQRIEEIFVNKTPYDVIYIGSSRTHLTIYPKIVDSITGLSTYNAGIQGGAIKEFKMTLDGYLVNHPNPKMVVLTIDPLSVDLTYQMFDPTQYFPFSEKNEVIEKAFEDMAEDNLALQKIPFLRLAAYMDDHVKANALKGWAGQTEIRKGDFESKGFLSNGTKCLDSTRESAEAKRFNEIRKESLDLLRSMIDTCKSRNIRLILTFAPEYRHTYKKYFSNFDPFIDTMQAITQNNHLHFYRDDSLAMNSNPCYFANFSHTNTLGAIEYSKILGLRIKELLAPDQHLQEP